MIEILLKAIDLMGDPDVLSEFDDYFRLTRLCLEVEDAETALGVVEGLIRARDDLAEAWALGGKFQYYVRYSSLFWMNNMLSCPFF